MIRTAKSATRPEPAPSANSATGNWLLATPCLSFPRPLFLRRPKRPRDSTNAKKRKKLPRFCCKVNLTLLSSTKSCEKHAEKTNKNSPRSAFYGPFAAKSRTFSTAAEHSFLPVCSLALCRGPQRQAHAAGVAWFHRSPFSSAFVPSPLVPAFTVPAARYERYAYGMDEVWKRYKALP